jgi:hypothetical protein
MNGDVNGREARVNLRLKSGDCRGYEYWALTLLRDVLSEPSFTDVHLEAVSRARRRGRLYTRWLDGEPD